MHFAVQPVTQVLAPTHPEEPAMDVAQFAQTILDEITRRLDDTNSSPCDNLDRIAYLTLAYREVLVRSQVTAQHGLVVQGGPFAGLKYVDQSVGSALLPKLIGSYEAELHRIIEQLPACQYTTIVNIGCGEGYYAVGLARLLPSVQVIAFDTAEQAQALCRALAELNGVAERVSVRGECTIKGLRELCRPHTLVLCDCEGAELTLLEPQAVPGLAHCDVLVELHDFLTPSISSQIGERFAATHEVEILPHGGRNPADYPALRSCDQFVQLLAMCEFRPGPTPWALMRAKRSVPR